MLLDVNVDIYPDVLKHFPNYNYRECFTDGVPTPERVDYRRGDNVTGHQQRAFIMYWAIENLATGLVGIEWGGAVSTPGCIDVDIYAGDGTGRSDGKNPHIQCDACNMSMLRDGKWGSVLSNHAMEHFSDPFQAAREAFRLMSQGRYFAMTVPDASIQSWNYEDEHHVTAFLPDANSQIYAYDSSVVGDPKNIVYLDRFAEWLARDLGAEIIELNTLNNNFSLNLVARKN